MPTTNISLTIKCKRDLLFNEVEISTYSHFIDREYKKRDLKGPPGLADRKYF
jgi:hypothetical protein